jgi:hypothetical protein
MRRSFGFGGGVRFRDCDAGVMECVHDEKEGGRWVRARGKHPSSYHFPSFPSLHAFDRRQ